MMESYLEQRLLVNYRVDPSRVRPLVPPALDLEVRNGWAVGGLCILNFRMGGALAIRGIAHRVAVRQGVFVLRRDTNSRLVQLSGGRVFPGVHRLGAIEIRPGEADARLADRADVEVRFEPAHRFEPTLLFGTFPEVETFFQGGTLGFSLGHDGRTLEQMQLAFPEWKMEPVRILQARSRFWESLGAQVDHGAVMRDQRMQISAQKAA